VSTISEAVEQKKVLQELIKNAINNYETLNKGVFIESITIERWNDIKQIDKVNTAVYIKTEIK
jgi:predicted alpha/beta-fold hydrolase